MSILCRESFCVWNSAGYCKMDNLCIGKGGYCEFLKYEVEAININHIKKLKPKELKRFIINNRLQIKIQKDSIKKQLIKLWESTDGLNTKEFPIKI